MREQAGSEQPRLLKTEPVPCSVLLGLAGGKQWVQQGRHGWVGACSFSGAIWDGSCCGRYPGSPEVLPGTGGTLSTPLPLLIVNANNLLNLDFSPLLGSKCWVVPPDKKHSAKICSVYL